jgi:hypothetical protein
LYLSIASINAASAAPPGKKASSKPAAAAKQNKPAQSAPSGASSAELNSYANNMRQKMAASWNYPAGNNKVTLKVEVAGDGSVSNMTLDSTPKNADAEQKANDAFNAAQPLSGLPSGITAATITCQFDSNADQWSAGKANISVKIDPQKSAAPPASGTNSSNTENKDEKK